MQVSYSEELSRACRRLCSDLDLDDLNGNGNVNMYSIHFDLIPCRANDRPDFVSNLGHFPGLWACETFDGRDLLRDLT
jgi:hypothetical protein